MWVPKSSSVSECLTISEHKDRAGYVSETTVLLALGKYRTSSAREWVALMSTLGCGTYAPRFMQQLWWTTSTLSSHFLAIGPKKKKKEQKTLTLILKLHLTKRNKLKNKTKQSPPLEKIHQQSMFSFSLCREGLKCNLAKHSRLEA